MFRIVTYIGTLILVVSCGLKSEKDHRIGETIQVREEVDHKVISLSKVKPKAQLIKVFDKGVGVPYDSGNVLQGFVNNSDTKPAFSLSLSDFVGLANDSGCAKSLHALINSGQPGEALMCNRTVDFNDFSSIVLWRQGKSPKKLTSPVLTYDDINDVLTVTLMF